MKRFFKNLLKFAIAVSSITTAAILLYRFFKKYVTIEHGETTVSDTDHAEKADSTETDGEAKPVNRKYVNIVLDWDQPEDAPSKEEKKQETAQDDAEQPQAPTEEENPETSEQETEKEEENTDSSIHLD